MLELSYRGFLPGGGREARQATERRGFSADGPSPVLVLSDRRGRRYLARFLAVLVWFVACAGTGRLQAQDSCVMCHANMEFMIGVAGDSARGEALWVDPEEYAATVHGGFGFTCTTCHAGMSDYPHGAPVPVACGGCHAAAEAQLAASVHGHPFHGEGDTPATCADCHTDHHIRRIRDPESSVYRLTQFETCARCHEDAERMGRFGQDNVETVSTYLHSVHGRGLLEKGLSVAPVCTDCHGRDGNGAHEIQETEDSASAMHRDHVVETCGRCHAGIMAQYDRGIHGSLFREGNPDTPTCVSCHGEHGVQPITSPTSGVNPRHVSQTCTACHDREDFNEKYGLETARGRTFKESFHGIALQTGQLTVANCESCHGAHEILPSSDPKSLIHPVNLVRTCGSCHPGIGEGVLEGKIHVASVVEEQGLVGKIVLWFYVIVIGTTVFYALGLFLLDQYRYRVVDPRRGGHHG